MTTPFDWHVIPERSHTELRSCDIPGEEEVSFSIQRTFRPVAGDIGFDPHLLDAIYREVVDLIDRRLREAADGSFDDGPESPAIDDALQAEVASWCERFHVPFEGDNDPNAVADAGAVVEEAGEVMKAALKRWHGQRPGTDWNAKLRKEAAQTVITLLSLAANEGFSLADAVAEVWAATPREYDERNAAAAVESNVITGAGWPALNRVDPLTEVARMVVETGAVDASVDEVRAAMEALQGAGAPGGHPAETLANVGYEPAPPYVEACPLCGSDDPGLRFVPRLSKSLCGHNWHARVSEEDPEIKKLLAEEEAIERSVREHHETPGGVDVEAAVDRIRPGIERVIERSTFVAEDPASDDPHIMGEADADGGGTYIPLPDKHHRWPECENEACGWRHDPNQACFTRAAEESVGQDPLRAKLLRIAEGWERVAVSNEQAAKASETDATQLALGASADAYSACFHDLRSALRED